jgi:hypothetical protein
MGCEDCGLLHTGDKSFIERGAKFAETPLSSPGLPDGFFSNQTSQIG